MTITRKPLKARTAQPLAISLRGSKLLAVTTLALAGVLFATACAPEPTEPAKTSLAGTWSAPNGRKQLYNALMFVGYSVGGVIAALLALAFLQPLGFRWLIAFR